jgi:hypothetical protein
MIDIRKLEEMSIKPLLWIGHTAATSFFILNCLMAYNVADSISQLSPNIHIIRVYSLIVFGMLLNILLVITQMRMGKEDSKSHTKRELYALNVMKIASIGIQLLIFSNIIYSTFVSTNEDYLLVSVWTFGNFFVGVAADFISGFLIVVYTESIQNKEKK